MMYIVNCISVPFIVTLDKSKSEQFCVHSLMSYIKFGNRAMKRFFLKDFPIEAVQRL